MKIFILMLSILYSLTANENENEFLNHIPKGYSIFDVVSGDLNKDNLEDKVIIIKGTDKSKFEMNHFGKSVDRNRRGIVVLLNTSNGYKKVLINNSCFSSDNEDGGAYYPPELDLEINNKGNLLIKYFHGRYGSWYYTFRFKYTDFELIGFDNVNTIGPVIQNVTSINFLTKKKLYKLNLNRENNEENELFKEIWSSIAIDKSIILSEVKDFDELDMNY